MPTGVYHVPSKRPPGGPPRDHSDWFIQKMFFILLKRKKSHQETTKIGSFNKSFPFYVKNKMTTKRPPGFPSIKMPLPGE